MASPFWLRLFNKVSGFGWKFIDLRVHWVGYFLTPSMFNVKFSPTFSLINEKKKFVLSKNH
jgi:hypothetical protein